jgi:hypothetical protein
MNLRKRIIFKLDNYTYLGEENNFQIFKFSNFQIRKLYTYLGEENNFQIFKFSN